MSDLFQHLLKLPDSDLEALANALRSGRLVADSPASAIERIVASTKGIEISEVLGVWFNEGMTSVQVAIVVEGMVAARRSQPRMSDEVELVWTGPEMPEMINRDAAVVLRELFQQARESILVVGFAAYKARTIFQELANRHVEQPGLHIRICLNIERKFGDTSLESELVRRFASKFRKDHWPPDRTLPDLYYDPRSLAIDPECRSSLHAKCVVVDRTVALVTSANLTEAALKRNIEVGAIIRSPTFASQLSEHFGALIRNGILNKV